MLRDNGVADTTKARTTFAGNKVLLQGSMSQAALIGLPFFAAWLCSLQRSRQIGPMSRLKLDALLEEVESRIIFFFG
jgi:hypothetical protein